MKGYIDGIDFVELEPMKYWSFSSSTSQTTKKDTVRNAIFSGEYIGTLKVDGYYQRLVKDEDGNCFMIARSRNVKGEVVDKYEWVPQIHEWMSELPLGTCLLCEAYLPGKEGSKNVTSILGCLQAKAISRQVKTPLYFHVFDVIADQGKSLLNTHYEDRVELLNSYWRAYPCQYVDYAEPYEGQELWDKLAEYLAEGREGMVIMRKDAIVYQKRTPARVSIKIKKEIADTIDCFFTGRGTAPTKNYTGKELKNWQYWVNPISDDRLPIQSYYREYMEGEPVMPVTKPYYYKWCGSLEIGLVKDDKVVPIGYLSGLADEIKANPTAYKGKVIEVSAMQVEEDTKALRHAKMIQFREDKLWKECEWSQLENL